MAGLEVGSVCIKTRGKEAGRKAIVLEFDKNKGIAVVAGPFVKKRKCNLAHLLPTGKAVKAKKGITGKEIAGLLKEV